MDSGHTRRQSGRAAELLERLGLSEDELCQILDVDPLSLLSGQLDHRPELAILLALIDEAEETVGGAGLRRWMRVAGPTGTDGVRAGSRPIDMLTSRDFAAFEDALATLAQRGLVIRGGGDG